MMNQVLQPSPSLASENPFSSEEGYIDHIGAHAHHNSFASVSDQFRREPVLAHPAAGLHQGSIAGCYGTHRPDSAYQASAALSDSGSASISTSPSSTASSALAHSYATFPQTVATTYPSHFPLVFNPVWGNGGSMSSTRRLNDASSTGMLPTARSPGLGHSVSPSVGSSARDSYTTGTSAMHRYSHTLSPRSDLSGYISQPDTPRSVLPTSMPLTNYNNGYHTSAYVPPTGSPESPPFNAQSTWGTIVCEGTTVTPTLDAKVEKGFFFSSDRVWTCYRRNYFSVNVSYQLSPWTPNGRLYLDQNNGKPSEQIQSMAVSLGAAVDGASGKTIELVQHTPKRDKGPQLTMKKELVAPTPPGKSHEHGSYALNSFHQTSAVAGPHLPLQNENESQQYSPTGHGSSNYQHSFERIQFKSATANNGKRRAQQQYYHLIVELWANVQKPQEDGPRWVKVAARLSHPVVVRGRSPSHYQNEGPHNASASRGAPGSGLGGNGHHGLGSNGRTSYSSYGNAMSGSGTTGMGGSMYRGNTYSLDPSPVGSHSISSSSSLSGGNIQGIVGDQQMVEDSDSKMMDPPQDYSYYPAPIYESTASKYEGALPPPDRRVKEEYPSAAWQGGGCGRFQGIESSRGYYPDVQTHTY
ncbi:hypothetical protein COCHEDRAFT_1192233 [Bipolaris maydis C5]|uniref:NDT80 domain-containing protein n=1 Tax=Cochliobolus heterostrophus (strain C5 / ATCC 48332 / race O) TaxID=701091 RepID=M2V220_COCH5|nr:hypothetical protein COCHEDRAFT_1192233 [Bipolaris maydis C5]KAJ5026718.1 hypothetical protein J3E73DRAFT_431675 [Bipolaris maydis]KAJ6271473.1 hypothetical protein PSV08DRAFT_409451 [Bipolaris maydis]